MIYRSLLIAILLICTPAKADTNYHKFREARDAISEALFTKIHRYGSDYFLGSNQDINRLILWSALDDAMKTVAKYPVTYMVKVNPINGFPAHTLVADVIVVYVDETSSISWNFNITLIPGHPPFFHREVVGGTPHYKRAVELRNRVSL